MTLTNLFSFFAAILTPPYIRPVPVSFLPSQFVNIKNAKLITFVNNPTAEPNENLDDLIPTVYTYVEITSEVFLI